jgi:hypothetical protein
MRRRGTFGTHGVWSLLGCGICKGIVEGLVSLRSAAGSSIPRFDGGLFPLPRRSQSLISPPQMLSLMLLSLMLLSLCLLGVDPSL